MWGLWTVLVLGAPEAVAQEATPAAWTCCEVRPVARIVELYLDLEELLAAGDAGTSGKVYALVGATKTALKEPGVRHEDRQVLEALLVAAEAMKDKKLETARARFDPVSRAVAHLALNYPGAGIEIVEAYCPEGGTWLQRPGALRSPYGDGCAKWR
ncbi:MAG: hypothetical protein JXX28_14435 [Deltaproteobacteria bacterium]|nr:hypothetical protein [Deltaproteobacteria bacterium]